MTPTPEQSAILDINVPPYSAVKLIAYAGTGKTSTLIEVANKYPNGDVLYLAFNKSVASDAVMRFPCNTTAKTIHSLAYHHVGHEYAPITNLYNWQIAKSLSMTLYEATLVQKTLESYLNSADDRVFPCHVEPDYLHRMSESFYVEGTIANVEDLWTQMCDGRNGMTMTHSGYLKLFGLKSPSLGFNTVLLDEAQDTNPVTLKLALDQVERGARLYLVGDPYQQIYSWRDALDAMSKIDCPSYRLTQSFRFGPAIAGLASKLLKHSFNEQYPLQGLPSIESHIDSITNKRHTIICRTNAGLIREAHACAVQGLPIHVVGEQAFQQAMSQTMDIYHLYTGNKQLINGRRISFHGNFARLKAYAEATQDLELGSKVGVVEEYASGTPRVLDTIKSQLTDQQGAEVLLTTCHKAKGLEWPNVRLSEDFSELFGVAETLNGPKRFLKKVVPLATNDDEEISAEEVNLIYVALTRSEYCLSPHSDLKALHNYNPISSTDEKAALDLQ